MTTPSPEQSIDDALEARHYFQQRRFTEYANHLFSMDRERALNCINALVMMHDIETQEKK